MLFRSMTECSARQDIVSLQLQQTHLLTAARTTNDLLTKILEFLQQPSGSDIRDLIIQILARFDSVEQHIAAQTQLLSTILNEIRAAQPGHRTINLG